MADDGVGKQGRQCAIQFVRWHHDLGRRRDKWDESGRVALDCVTQARQAECAVVGVEKVGVHGLAARESEGCTVVRAPQPDESRRLGCPPGAVKGGDETTVGNAGEDSNDPDVCVCREHMPRAQDGVVGVRGENDDRRATYGHRRHVRHDWSGLPRLD
jgi:hypothetical protein